MAYPDLILAANPITYWRGNFRIGTTVANAAPSGFSFELMADNGTITTGASFLPGVPSGSCLIFPGTAGIAVRNTFPTFIGFNTSGVILPRSFEFWIFPDEDAGLDGGLMAWYVSTTPLIGAQTLGKFKLNIGASLTAPFGYAYLRGAARPIHVVLVIEGGNAPPRVKSYVNSVLAEDFIDANGRSATGDNSTVALGVNLGGAGLPTFKGRMQEVAWYTSALTATVVAQHYWAGVDDGAEGRVLSARLVGINTIRVVFSKATFGADTSGNWSVSGGVTVSSVALVGSDYTTYDLTVANLDPLSPYTVTALAGITDALGVALSDSDAVMTATTPGSTVPDPTVLIGQQLVTVTPGSVAKNICPPEAVHYFHMRARHATFGTVWWTTVVEPDFTGASSGYNIVDLSDIVLVEDYVVT